MELERLREDVKKIFGYIGTERSRQKLVYDLLNSLRSRQWDKFKFLIFKNINTVMANEEVSNKAKEFIDRFAGLLEKYGYNEEEFERIAYTVVMGIMSAESSEVKE